MPTHEQTFTFENEEAKEIDRSRIEHELAQDAFTQYALEGNPHIILGAE